MSTIPPSLPPSYGGQFSPLGPTDAELVNTFKQLWDEWFDHPSVQTGTALLNYIKAHKAQIENIAKNNPQVLPVGNSGVQPIEKTFETAINYLTNWIQSEKTHPPVDPTPASEFLKDLYNWIWYAR